MIKRTLRRLLLPLSFKLERVKIIQTIIVAKKAKTYLEIGVDQGKVFEIIHGPFKIGVDPVAPAKKVQKVLDQKNIYFQKTSDDFFRVDAPVILQDKKIDVAFIDGLHEYTQVLRDIENTLHYLADDGIILIHDCNPWSRASAIRALSFDKAIEIAKRDQYSDWDGGWTGDVWKSIAHLRKHNSNLDIFVLDCDCGIGVIRKTSKSRRVPDIKDVASLTYDDLALNRTEFLNLKEAPYFFEFLKEIN